MSDESTPPPLRLKPRVRPETGAAPTVPTVAPAPAESGDSAAVSPALRLKPKLAGESAPSAVAPSPGPSGTGAISDGASGPDGKPRLKPRLGVQAEPGVDPALGAILPSADSVAAAVVGPDSAVPPERPCASSAMATPLSPEAPKFRLRTAAAELPLPGERTRLPPPPGLGAKALPPFAVVKPAEPPPLASDPQYKVGTAPPEQTVPPPPSPRRRPWRLYALAGSGLALLAAALAAFRLLTAELPAEPPRAKAVPADAKPPTAAPVLGAATEKKSALGRAVARAEGVVADRAAGEQVRGDAPRPGTASGGAPVARSAPTGSDAGADLNALPKPGGAAAARSATVTAQIAPGVMATITVEVTGDASEPFRTWVAAAKISGVFQGEPARALINGRMIRAGQTVDDGLVIVFDRVNADTKQIVFRDRSGATVAKRY